MISNIFIFGTFSRDVYDKLVAEGTIIPRPEEAPPTVPMDYAWARVGHLPLSLYALDKLSVIEQVYIYSKEPTKHT